MSDNIEELGLKIINKTNNLINEITKKRHSITPSNLTPYFQAVENFLVSIDIMKITSPFTKLKESAQEGLKAVYAKSLDLTQLNESKPGLLAKLFPKSSEIQPEDYAESRQKEYESAFKIRKGLSIFPNIFPNFSIENWIAPLPKTIIEEEWDALEHLVERFNHAVEINNSLKTTKVKNSHTQLSKLNIDTVKLILSYLNPIELIAVHQSPECNIGLRIEESMNDSMGKMKEDGFPEHAFFYLKVNPLIISFDNNLYRSLKQLLQDGFHPAIFNTIDPKRFVHAPCIENAAFDEQLLTAETFPDNHRVVRGRDEGNKPFIGILNSKNIPVRFYQYDHHRHNFWENDTGPLGNLDVAELKIPITRSINFKAEPSDIKNSTYGVAEGKNIEPSFEKWQEWLALFLSYINESCPKKNGDSYDPFILEGLRVKLAHIVSDRYPCVDRAEYPETELPHTRPGW
ncbi:MAG: hypothetical protein CK424_03155 [Legionella sp.]|nr:MAG: hypothetical protein CK424_03155 [Legionella sp.]